MGCLISCAAVISILLNERERHFARLNCWGGGARPQAISYSKVDTGRSPSAVPSSSNFPPSHFGSEPGLIAQSYRAFSSPPLWPTYTIAPAGAVATSQGGLPARQHQGPEGVIRNVIASMIRAIAIMTNAVETNRILGSPPSWCVTPPCLPNCYGELFLPICIESARIRHHDDTGSIGTKNRV